MLYMPFKIKDVVPIFIPTINVKMTSQNDVSSFLIKLGVFYSMIFFRSANSGI